MKLERYQIEQFARFLGKLKSVREPGTGGTLLESTMALLGSGMGNATRHTNSNLPIILAGGGSATANTCDVRRGRQRVPLCNLYLSILQRFGVETDRFSTSTGTLSGLEVA